MEVILEDVSVDHSGQVFCGRLTESIYMLSSEKRETAKTEVEEERKERLGTNT